MHREQKIGRTGPTIDINNASRLRGVTVIKAGRSSIIHETSETERSATPAGDLRERARHRARFKLSSAAFRSVNPARLSNEFNIAVSPG